MSHSPLAATIVFYAGPVPVTETVITTWALMAALTIAMRVGDAPPNRDSHRPAGDG